MCSKRAFTLIEVMVVLGILAIIAILAYNFFGGTMKEAKQKQQLTKTYNDLRVLADAYDLAFIKSGGYPGVDEFPISTPLSEGVIKSIPTSDLDGFVMYGYNFSNPARSVMLLALTDNLAEFCTAFNQAYSGLATWWDYIGNGSAHPTGEMIYCAIDTSATPDTAMFISYLESN